MYIYIYIYTYECVCVCVCVSSIPSVYSQFPSLHATFLDIKSVIR